MVCAICHRKQIYLTHVFEVTIRSKHSITTILRIEEIYISVIKVFRYHEICTCTIHVKNLCLGPSLDVSDRTFPQDSGFETGLG